MPTVPLGAPAAAAAAIVACLLAGGLTGCTPALDWREVRAADASSGLRLLMPCRPARQERDVALAGAPVPLTLQACSAAAATWALACARLGDPARVGPALDALLASAAVNVDAVGAPVRQSAAVPGATPNAASGRAQLSGRRPAGAPVRMALLLFSRGTLACQATVLAESLDEAATETYFGSIRFEP